MKKHKKPTTGPWGSLSPSDDSRKSAFVDIPDNTVAVARKDTDNETGDIYLNVKNPFQPTQWGLVASNAWKSQSLTSKILEPGEYGIAIDGRDDRPVFTKKNGKSDDLIRFQGGLADTVFREIANFWDKGESFKKIGFLHRRGYIFYCPAGGGKTSIVKQILNSIVEHGGVVFHCSHPGAFSVGLEAFRQVEPDRPIVCVFEDIDALIKKFGDDDILSILDGTNQVNKVLNLATTNFPENLDKRIVSRPRRFDRIYKILAPDEKTRRAYLKLKLPKREKLDIWVKKTEDLSFAGLTEAVISVICLGNPLDEVIETLKKLEQGKPSSDDGGPDVGFKDLSKDK